MQIFTVTKYHPTHRLQVGGKNYGLEVGTAEESERSDLGHCLGDLEVADTRFLKCALGYRSDLCALFKDDIFEISATFEELKSKRRDAGRNGD